jgi:methyl-accepting chemotaxis protein
MNKKISPDERVFPPVLTIFESIIVTLCLSASVFLFYLSFREDVTHGFPKSLADKLHNEDFINALVLFILAVIYVIVRIVNFHLFAKPLRKILNNKNKVEASENANAARVETVKTYLAEGIHIAEKLAEHTDKNEDYIGGMQTGMKSISGAAKRLLQNISVIENAANRFTLNIESYKLIELLRKEKDLVADKLDICAGIIKEAVTKSNRLSLDAATESARMGEPGRGFAYVAEDIRQNAEELRFMAPIIRDALDGAAAQTALLDKMAEDYIKTIGVNITDDPAPGNTVGVPDNIQPETEAAGIITQAAENTGGFDPDAWAYEYARVREQLEAIRDAIKSIGAALSTDFNPEAPDDEYMAAVADNNSEISDLIKSLKATLAKIDETVGGGLNNVGI